MHRFFARLLGGETSGLPDNEEEPVLTKTEDQIQALHDLETTYTHPIKSCHATSFKRDGEKKNSISILKQREYGLVNFHRYPQARYRLVDRLLPDDGQVVASMSTPTFCGQFSDDGQRFVSACQDHCIRLYDTSSSRTFDRLAEIQVGAIGWSILDTALSPNRTCVAYSTWSNCIYLVQLNENQNRSNIMPLDLRPDAYSFSVFSLQFSVDGSEIICGSNDTCVYVFDLQRNQRTLCVQAHQNDVNAVRFIDDSTSLVASGSDDGLISVWDRRALNENQPKPVGIFAGHSSGITFVHSRMDTRYLISNSKDQSIKLWDMRRFADESTIQRCRDTSNAVSQVWDYRMGAQPRALLRRAIPGDPSVCTYRGHSVGFTLIRCYFSPSFTTGQRYIITGSSDGCIYIYNVLTGSVERRLSIRNNNYGVRRETCVRDVSWHPFENYIVSTSWDNQRSHVRWTYRNSPPTEPCLSPPVETNVASTQVSPSSPTQRSFNHLTTFERLLVRQFLGDDDDDEDENEMEEDEEEPEADDKQEDMASENDSLFD